MKKTSPVWLLLIAALLLVPVTMNLGAGASTRGDYHPIRREIGRRTSAQTPAAPSAIFTVTTTADTGAGS